MYRALILYSIDIFSSAEPTIPACHIKYEKIGCFHDPVKTDNRPLPELLDSHRDRTSNSFHGLSLDWKNYRTSLKM